MLDFPTLKGSGICSFPVIDLHKRERERERKKNNPVLIKVPTSSFECRNPLHCDFLTQ